MQRVDLAGNVTKTLAEFPLWPRSAVGRQRKQRVDRFRVVPCFDESLVEGLGRSLPVIDGFRLRRFRRDTRYVSACRQGQGQSHILVLEFRI